MHLIDLLTQFDLTYDISSLEAGDFLALLPKAFNRFRPLEERKSRRHSRPEEDRAEPPLPALGRKGYKALENTGFLDACC